MTERFSNSKAPSATSTWVPFAFLRSKTLFLSANSTGVGQPRKESRTEEQIRDELISRPICEHSSIRIDSQSHLAPPLNRKSSDDAKFLALLIEELLQLKGCLNGRMHGFETF